MFFPCSVLSGDFIREARLQNEVGTKDFFRGTIFLAKNAPKCSPNFLSLSFVCPKKCRKIPAKIPARFLSPPQKKDQRASAEAQREDFAVVHTNITDLRWAKSRDNYRRGASESYLCDSNR